MVREISNPVVVSLCGDLPSFGLSAEYETLKGRLYG